MLSGYCRMTYSLNVMLLETTQSINLFIPILLTMLTSYLTANFFNFSLYNRALRGKQVPMLKDFVPEMNQNMRAKVIMKEDVIALSLIPTVDEIGTALSFGYKSFPVLNKCGQLVGNVSAHFLVLLLKNQAWYSKTVEAQALANVTEAQSPNDETDESPFDTNDENRAVS